MEQVLILTSEALYLYLQISHDLFCIIHSQIGKKESIADTASTFVLKNCIRISINDMFLTELGCFIIKQT